MAKETFGCGRKECSASTGICGKATFGTGELDDWGYWEHPCGLCAREWERRTGELAWPLKPLPKTGE